jgi:hypothetical protein
VKRASGASENVPLRFDMKRKQQEVKLTQSVK